MHSRSLSRRRPSAPMIISLAALLVSLGGVSYAAVSLPAGSVGTEQIRDNAVTYKKIQPSSVGRVRLADGGVVNSKLANSSVSYLKIQPEAVGHVRANLDQLQARVNGRVRRRTRRSPRSTRPGSRPAPPCRRPSSAPPRHRR